MQVVEILDEAPLDVPAVAAAAAHAAGQRLAKLPDDPSLTYSFWLLTRIASASRGEAFAADLERLGLRVDESTSSLAFISLVTDAVRARLSSETTSGHLAELASLALRRALSETVGQQGHSLFDSSIADLQRAVRVYSTQARFGALSRRFFGDLFARFLRAAVDRDIQRHVGKGATLQSVDEAGDFQRALDTYARQSALIVEDFAGSWFSKHDWETREDISLDEARGFVAVAVRKLRMELKFGTVP
ncbi:MAG: hypothetical protein WEC75_14980 [Dehalococcoidia bacterium]